MRQITHQDQHPRIGVVGQGCIQHRLETHHRIKPDDGVTRAGDMDVGDHDNLGHCRRSYLHLVGVEHPIR